MYLNVSVKESRENTQVQSENEIKKSTVPFFTLGSGSRAPSWNDAMSISYTWKKRGDWKSQVNLFQFS